MSLLQLCNPHFHVSSVCYWRCIIKFHPCKLASLYHGKHFMRPSHRIHQSQRFSVLKLLDDHPAFYLSHFYFFSYTRIGATAHMGPANCQHACWLHPQQHDSAEKSSLRKRRTYERRADTGSMLKWYPKDAQWGESAPQLKPKGGPADLTHLYYTRPPSSKHHQHACTQLQQSYSPQRNLKQRPFWHIYTCGSARGSGRWAARF